MNGRKFRRRPVTVDAQRFNNGIFTKAEWLDFCPDANIGCSGRSRAEALESRDFGWFAVSNVDLSVTMVREGDYVVREFRDDGDVFLVCDAAVFARTYESAYG